MFKKKSIAVFITSIITVCALCVNVFAYIRLTPPWSDGKYTYYDYSFDVSYKWESSDTFYIGENGTYQFSFGGATGEGATVEVRPRYSTNAVATITIPAQMPGTPTLYRSIDLSEGTYYLYIRSNSKNVNSAGGITVRV